MTNAAPTDADVKSLAAEIAGSWGDDASTPKPTTEGDKPKVEEQQPDASPKPDADTSGTKDDSVGDSADQDPLGKVTIAELRNNPKVIEELLKDAKLAPALNSYADRVANTRLEVETPKIQQNLQQRMETEILNKYFSGLTKEELGKALAEDDQLAGEYARIQAEKQNAPKANDDEIARAALVLAYQVQIQTNLQVIKESELPDEVKTKLSPDNYRQYGQEGMVRWSADIQRELMNHNVGKEVAKQKDTSREAARQEVLAEQETGYPGANVTKGNRSDPLPDLETTSSQHLLERAFANNGRK